MYWYKYDIDILDRFQMIDCKPNPIAFQSEVRLEDVNASPLVDCTRVHIKICPLPWIKTYLLVK
jgi:hypothetical protein